MDSYTSVNMPRSVPNKTKTQPRAESSKEPLGVPTVGVPARGVSGVGAPAVKVTDDQQLTSQTASRDRIKISSLTQDDSSVTSPSRDESNRAQRPSKAERILGLTTRDFESAATEARRREGGPVPPANLELRPVTPTISIGSPRTTRRRGDAGKTTSTPSPSDPNSRRSAAAQKSSATKSTTAAAALQLPSERRGFTASASSASASSSNTDLKLIGYGSEADSDVDLSSVVDDGSSTSSTVFTPKKRSEHRGRDRFKKILRPVTRSKSAGAGERVPAHALFLRHQHDQKPSMVNRSTDDVMRNSADYTESEEETTDGKLPGGGSKQKKDRFSFFRRSEGHSGHGSSNALLPSSETLQGWAKSFEKLLADKYGIKLFRDFLRREFSDENVEFWIECEKYRHLTSEKQRIAESKKIFREFVAIQAPNEINLDSKTRETTESNLSRAEPRLFESAQKRIEALMEKDSYPRFLQSDIFQRLLQQRQAADNSLRVT